MPEHHRNNDIDPDIASLARVKPSTWKLVVAGIVWLFGLSAGVADNRAQIARVKDEKADKQILDLQRANDRDSLARQLEEVNRRLGIIEKNQEKQTTPADIANAIVIALQQHDPQRR